MPLTKQNLKYILQVQINNLKSRNSKNMQNLNSKWFQRLNIQMTLFIHGYGFTVKSIIACTSSEGDIVKSTCWILMCRFFIPEYFSSFQACIRWTKQGRSRLQWNLITIVYHNRSDYVDIATSSANERTGKFLIRTGWDYTKNFTQFLSRTSRLCGAAPCYQVNLSNFIYIYY